MQLDNPFITLYEELCELNESNRPFSNGYLELAKPIDLSKCRMIDSDVVDVRGELEKSACLVYNNVLTRVSAQALIFRDGPEGKEVLMRLWRSAVYLPGGGVDLDKDGPSAENAVRREAYEEVNLNITNIRPTNSSFWEYSEKPWVERHVANAEDRWNGYYTFIFTADYEGEGTNDLPEEAGRYRWHKVQDILDRPNTRKLAYLKDAIISNGYATSTAVAEESTEDLEEDVLTEAKQLGYVSYAVREPRGKSTLASLNNILHTEVILASTDSDGSKYVSTSRDLVGHLGSQWRCAVILDGDKLTNKYKFNAVNANSQVYFGTEASGKELMLKFIRKYQARDEQTKELIPDTFMYLVEMQGSSFVNTITEPVYEALKTIMLAYNAQDAVSATGKAQDKYKNKTNREVKQFYALQGVDGKLTADNFTHQFSNSDTNEPYSWVGDSVAKADGKAPSWVPIGTKRPKSLVPKKFSDRSWICIEAWGYNVPNSGLKLRINTLSPYKDLVISQHGIDITSQNFFKQLGGAYADEAEERAVPQIIKLVNSYGVEVESEEPFEGLDISGCILGILIDDSHREAFKNVSLEDLMSGNHKRLVLYDEGKKSTRYEDPANIPIIVDIRTYADAHGIPIIMYDKSTNNGSVIRQLKNS